jgi:hypothetical protein
MTTILALITLALALPWTSIQCGVEVTLQHISFVVAMVAVVGTIFVSTHGMMVPRMTATATDMAVMLISTARKR